MVFVRVKRDAFEARHEKEETLPREKNVERSVTRRGEQWLPLS